MNGWFISSSILLLIVIYLLYLWQDVKKITRQLVQITRMESNLEIQQLHSKNKWILQLAQKINQLIKNRKSARIALEENLKQTDQAIHNIAHDLRTPLTVSKGYAQYLLQNATSPEQQQLYLTKLIDQLTQTEKRLELLLNYSRLKDQSQSLTIEKVNLSNLLKQMMLNVYQSFEQKQFIVELEIEPELFLLTDHDTIERLFQNVIGNILLHGEKEATIKLYQQDQHIIFQTKNQTAQTIKNIEKLTERFYTEDLARQNQNAGLGLYLVQEFTSLTHGTLDIQYQKPNFQLTITWKKKLL